MLKGRSRTPRKRPHTARARDTRTLANLALWVGTALSVTFNVTETVRVTDSLAAPFVSLAWPLIATVGLELVIRAQWRKGLWWCLARYGGIGTIAVGAMAISYQHGHATLVSWNQSALTATVGPVVVDGLMVLAAAALLAARSPATPSRSRKRPTAKQPATRRAQLKAA